MGGSIGSEQLRRGLRTWVQIFSWRNEIDPTFLFLFTGQEVRRWLEDPNEDNDYEPRETAQLAVSAAVLGDRLGVLGIGRAALSLAFDAYAKEKLEILHHVRANVGDTVQPRIELLEKITPCRMGGTPY